LQRRGLGFYHHQLNCSGNPNEQKLHNLTERKNDMEQFNVAMLGFGVAGKAFARILIANHDEIMERTGYDVKVTTIATASRGVLNDMNGIDLSEASRQLEKDKHFDVNAPEYCEWSSFDVVDKAEYDVLMELTPLNIKTGQPAIDHIKGAMNRKKHVISANKGPIAWAFRELRELAKDKNVCFCYETAVMAGVPIFNMADYCLAYTKVSEVKGILNATTNYMLEQMELGLPTPEIYENGKKGGFMEADPSMDVEGYDAAAKLAALLNVLMDANIAPDQIERTGIENVTHKQVMDAVSRGNKLKLICHGGIVDGKVQATVRPEEIPASDAFAGPDVVATVSITTDLMGKISIVQYGIETTQTGYGVFIDLIRVLREMHN
jgi:homoserine dehydrogenase